VGLSIGYLTVSDDMNQDSHHAKIVIIMTVAMTILLGRVDFVAMVLVGLNLLMAVSRVLGLHGG
jgi:hypothetical protein